MRVLITAHHGTTRESGLVLKPNDADWRERQRRQDPER